MKVTGTINCEDVNVLSQMPQLEYLDLRDISFAYDDKHNDPVCMGNKSFFYLHSPIRNLQEFFVPNGAKGLSLTNYKDQTVLFSANIRKDEIDYYKKQTRYGSPYKSILENVIVHIPFGFMVDTPVKVLRIDGDPSSDYAKSFLLGLEKAEDKLVFEKKATANVLYPYFSQLEVPVIFVEEANFLHVNDAKKWSGDTITAEQIKKIDSFGKNALHGVEIPDSIELSERVQIIPDKLFSDFKNLKKIKLGNKIKYIGEEAFKETSIQSIDIPASVTELKRNAFSSSDLKNITLHTTTPPEWLEEIFSDLRRDLTVYIPDGTYLEYLKIQPIYGLERFKFIDNKLYGSYNINVPKGNTILSYIPLDSLLTADSLTISGILYEDDFKFIRQAQRLRYLDISQCYTTYSDEFLKEHRAKNQAMSALFSAISGMMDNAYIDNQVGTTEYQINKALADEIAKAYSSGSSNDEMCLIPHEALRDLKQLVVLKLPKLVTRIGPKAFQGCTNLEKVELPPFLTTISERAFAYCHRLENITLPQTVKLIEKEAFVNCNSFTKFVFPDVSQKDFFRFEDKILDS